MVALGMGAEIAVAIVSVVRADYGSAAVAIGVAFFAAWQLDRVR
jgi:hypothetical protein